MPWAKLDDGFWAHPKVLAAGNEAAGVYARALAYCGNQLTDGFLPAEVLQFIAVRRKPIDALLDAGLITREGAGYMIPDFLEYNPSREDKLGERSEARERMRRVRKNKRKRSPEQPPNVREKFGPRSDTPSRPVPNNPPNPPEGGDEEFADWLEHYRETTGRPARGSRAARRHFKARRRDGLSVPDLKCATVGAHSDDYCREHGYDRPETILLDSKVGRYIELGSKRNGKSPSASALDRLSHTEVPA